MGAAALLPVAALRAQDEPTFTTAIRVVNLLATVLDKHGELVAGLEKDDFLVQEDARSQTVRYFSRETGLPLTLGLLVDTSLSQTRLMAAERSASFHFLDRVLREDKDKVFIMQFDSGVMLRQPLTSSRRELDESLSLVDTPSEKELQAQGIAETMLYDAVVKASKEILSKQRNRKAVILLTDGVDYGSHSTLAEAIEAAQKADTIIYSILFADPSAYPAFGGAPDGRPGLMRMARETGGGFFEVSKRLNIEQTFDRIQQELRTQYSLGYVSDVPVRFPEFRKLRLSAKQKGLTVRTRERYWAHQ